MKALRVAVLPLALALALLASACGGSESKKVPAGAVAVVGDRTITKADFDAVIARAKVGFKQQKRQFPKPGTPQFQQIKNSAIQYLVQREEIEQKAKEMDVSVKPKQVDSRIAQIKRQLGGQKAFDAQLKANGLTLTQAKKDIVEPQLLSEGIYNKVTGDVKVSDADVAKYYRSHLKQYQQPESRDVRHILVSAKKKALANQIYDRLKGGASFAKLAKKYSQDTASAAQGGRLSIVKGQTAGPFDQTAFLLDKGQISRPIKTQYGWHIIQALSAVRPAKTTPLKDVKDAIRQQLLQQRKNDAMTKWLNDTKKEFAKKTRYQVGYAPPKTTTGK
jgi:parvulin-like peptidyl-prolyl isomerase